MNFQSWRMDKYITVKVAVHLLRWNFTTNDMALCWARVCEGTRERRGHHWREAAAQGSSDNRRWWGLGTVMQQWWASTVRTRARQWWLGCNSTPRPPTSGAAENVAAVLVGLSIGAALVNGGLTRLQLNGGGHGGMKHGARMEEHWRGLHNARCLMRGGGVPNSARRQPRQWLGSMEERLGGGVGEEMASRHRVLGRDQDRMMDEGGGGWAAQSHVGGGGWTRCCTRGRVGIWWPWRESGGKNDSNLKFKRVQTDSNLFKFWSIQTGSFRAQKIRNKIWLGMIWKKEQLSP
jgi:hypothetical protein